MDEHYIPKESEFYIGFEYEFCEDVFKTPKFKTYTYNGGNRFESKSLGRLFSIQDVLKTELLRVKHVDREDIESFDFEFINTNKMSYWYEIEFCGHRLPNSSYSFWKIFLMHDPKRKIVKIEATVSNGDRETFFEGTIKNKSKLKEILNDIGILDGRD